MNDPILVPCLVALRNEFNEIGPRRDKASDGWWGNRAHAETESDHNPDETGKTPYEDADNLDEVHALDVDKSGPWLGGVTFDSRVEIIRLRHQRGQDDRLQYIIWRGRIASRDWGWTWRTYNGANGHYEHGHFSARYTTAQENDRRPWGVKEGVKLQLDQDDIRAVTAAVAPAVVAAQAAAAVDKTGTYYSRHRGLPWQYPVTVDMSALAMLSAIHANTLATRTLVQALTAQDHVDEQALGAALAAALAPAVVTALVEALPDDMTLTEDEVQARVEAGVEAVVGRWVGKSSATDVT